MSHPHVSVGLPVYNGERYLRAAIESILNQDYEDFELVVSDNASTDGTQDICRGFARQDSRVRYYRSEVNLGAAPNHNRVFRLARGEYFKWTAHDDENYPSLLRECLEAVEGSDSVVLAYPQVELIDQEGGATGEYLVSIASESSRPQQRLARVLCNIDLGTPLYGVVRTDALSRTRLHGSYISADYVMLAELALLGVIREVPKVLLRKRLHPGRSMEANTNRQEFRVWFDSRNARKLFVLQPGDRLVMEYLRSILRLPRAALSVAEKLSCMWTVARCTQRERVERWRARFRKLMWMRRSR